MEPQVQSVARTADRAGGIFSLLVSFVVHLGLLLVLAVWICLPGTAGHGLFLSGDIAVSEEVELDLSASEPAEPVEAVFSETVSPPEFAIDFNVDIDPESLEADAGKNHLAAIAASAKSFASVQNPLKTSHKKGAAFFGAYAEGARFVYVIDSSTSMTGERWLYACNQLIDSLQQLRPDQEFYVISFDIKPSFMFSRGANPGDYVRNDTKTIAKIRSWLKTKILGRGTRPARALEYALAMKPDAIFLLSDGELQDNTIMRLRMLNRPDSSQSQIPIHSVHLFSMEGRATLELIAFENGGTFTPVGGRW